MTGFGESLSPNRLATKISELSNGSVEEAETAKELIIDAQEIISFCDNCAHFTRFIFNSIQLLF